MSGVDPFPQPRLDRQRLAAAAGDAARRMDLVGRAADDGGEEIGVGDHPWRPIARSCARRLLEYGDTVTDPVSRPAQERARTVVASGAPRPRRA